MYILVILMYAMVGSPDVLTFRGQEPVLLDQCRIEGHRMMNWLAQDFISVSYECHPLAEDLDDETQQDQTTPISVPSSID